MKSILASKAPYAWEADPDSSPKRVKYYNFFLLLSLTKGCPFAFLSSPVRLWRPKTPLLATAISTWSSLSPCESLPFALKASAYALFRGCLAAAYPNCGSAASLSALSLFCTEAVEHHSYRNSWVTHQLWRKECSRPTHLVTVGDSGTPRKKWSLGFVTVRKPQCVSWPDRCSKT